MVGRVVAVDECWVVELCGGWVLKSRRMGVVEGELVEMVMVDPEGGEYELKDLVDGEGAWSQVAWRFMSAVTGLDIAQEAQRLFNEWTGGEICMEVDYVGAWEWGQG